MKDKTSGSWILNLTDKEFDNRFGDDDFPIVRNSPSIEEIEKRSSRGFWGNAMTGYIRDSQTK